MCFWFGLLSRCSRSQQPGQELFDLDDVCRMKVEVCSKVPWSDFLEEGPSFFKAEHLGIQEQGSIGFHYTECCPPGLVGVSIYRFQFPLDPKGVFGCVWMSFVQRKGFQFKVAQHVATKACMDECCGLVKDCQQKIFSDLVFLGVGAACAQALGFFDFPAGQVCAVWEESAGSQGPCAEFQ